MSDQNKIIVGISCFILALLIGLWILISNIPNVNSQLEEVADTTEQIVEDWSDRLDRELQEISDDTRDLFDPDEFFQMSDEEKRRESNS